MKDLVSLCKRRGFVFPNSEIYGGLNSCWDYGPLGVLLKNKVKKLWWNAMVRREDVVGLDSSILMHPKVWEASGHTKNFTDPLVDCRSCKTRFREESLLSSDLEETNREKKQLLCPQCHSSDLTPSRPFNLMFKTYIGPVEEEAAITYLRPETAQGIFTHFENVQNTTRKKIPFGIAQIGKAFRNEITPGHFIFRTREFEQMEMQYFVTPESAKEHFSKWRERRWNFYLQLGFQEAALRWHQHESNELAHYAKAAFDIHYRFPFGWSELEGLHNRGDFDLRQHQAMSGRKLETFQDNRKFLPYVIETSSGCDRLCLALLCHAYHEENLENATNAAKEKEKTLHQRLLLKLSPHLSPFTVAVLPLSKKPALQELAQSIRKNCSLDWDVDYDEAGNIGRRYRRQDEIGTPFCVTIDFQSLEDQKVTLRDRDSMQQERISIEKLDFSLRDRIKPLKL